MNKELFELLKSLNNCQCYIKSGNLHVTGHIEGLSTIKVKSSFIEFYQKLEWNQSEIANKLDNFLRSCNHLNNKGYYHEDKFKFIEETKTFIKNFEIKIGEFYPFDCKSYQVYYYKNVISAIDIVCLNNSIINLTQIKNESK